MLVENKMINKNEIAVVTSLDVAETFDKNHYDVLRDINNINETLNNTTQFCGLFFEDTYKASNGKRNPMFYMNRDGFTLLVMGYTGEKAMKFKLAYIKQFNAMEKALRGKFVEREKGIAVRYALTRAIQQSAENEKMHGHAYSIYTNVIYKALFGKNAAQLREDFGITKKQNLRDYFSEEDLKSVQNMEMCVSSLIGFGWSYEDIKEFILNQNTLKIAA